MKALLAALLSFACLQTAHAEQTSIEYAYAYPDIEATPLYIAQTKGYFADENLHVDVLSLSSGDKIALALVGGSIQIAAYTPDWFIRVMEKNDSTIKLVLGGSSVPIYSLIVGKNIHDYADLKGKTLGVSTLKASDTYLLKRMLAAHNLVPGNYDLIATGASPDRAAALGAGAIAGTLLAPPFDQRVIDNSGYQRLDVSSSAVPRYAWQAQAVRIDWAREHHAALVGFMRAWIRATHFLYDPANKEEVIKLIGTTLKIEDRYARTCYEMYFGGPVVTVPKEGEIDLAALQIMLDAMAEQGDVPTPTPPPAKYIDLSYWQEAKGK